MAYKIGNKLKVVNFEPNKIYPFGVNSEMKKCSGKIATITHVSKGHYDGNDINKYTIDLDGGLFNWADSMFESTPKIKVSKKELDTKKLKIINEINKNKDFKACFKDVSKEVNEWSNEKVLNF